MHRMEGTVVTPSIESQICCLLPESWSQETYFLTLSLFVYKMEMIITFNSQACRMKLSVEGDKLTVTR